MNSIHFILEEVKTTSEDKKRAWQSLVRQISDTEDTRVTATGCREVLLPLREIGGLTLLGRYIAAAEGAEFSYKLVFNGDGGEWTRIFQ